LLLAQTDDPDTLAEATWRAGIKNRAGFWIGENIS